MKDESSDSLAVSQLGRATQRDHAINAIKAALEAVPMVGGTLASLISDYIPQQKERRLIQFVQALSKDLSAVAERLDHDYMRSEQFSFLFEESCRAATRRYSDETLSALRSILVTSSVRFDVTQDIKEEFLRIASLMQPMHLRLLAFITEPYDQERFPYRGPEGGIRGARDDIEAAVGAYCFPEADVGVARALLTFLASCGLITNPYDLRATESGARHRLSTIHDFKRCLTPFGKRFLQFIQGRFDADPT